jgi:oligopeptide/dipeptide ABC transporter ATP-binding protein
MSRPSTDRPLLSVRDLEVAFPTGDGYLRAVAGVSLDLAAGELLALVGESGSGKSVTAQTIVGLTRSAGARIGGSVHLQGADLLTASEAELREVRGSRIAMVFQDPMTSLNPVYRVGDQIAEGVRAHRKLGQAEARSLAVEMLDAVGIPDPQRRARAFPHELSGGMRQRVTIAIALALAPEVLIADEPTTALDVTVQAQILELLRRLNRERGLATLLITHDLGIVAEMADRVAVMYAGRIVEEGSLDEVFYDPQHPYTWGLLGSLTRIDRPRPSRLPQIRGAPPNPTEVPPGCPFRPRCPHAFDRCSELPGLEPRLGDSPAHRDRCWLGTEEKRRRRQADGRIGLEETV